MTRRRRRQWVLLLIPVTLLTVWLTWPSWLPIVLEQFNIIDDQLSFIQDLDTLTSVTSKAAGILFNLVFAYLLWYFGVRESSTISRELNPLHPVTPDELRARLGRGGQVYWINRLATQPADLQRHRRLIITGRMKIGKTREALELIARAVSDLVPLDRVFEPAPAFQLLSKDSLPSALRNQLPTNTPVLLLLDDLPWHFAGDGLDQLSAALPVLDSCTAAYIIATARDEHLTPEHKIWLDRHAFHRVDVPSLSVGETQRLVDIASGVYGLRVEETAYSAFIAERDGTPENILATMRMLAEEDIIEVDSAVVSRYAKTSLEDFWAEARREVQHRHPAARPLFEALAAFHAARVPVYPCLMLHYAAYIWRGRTHSRPPFLPHPALRRALAALTPFDITVSGGELHYSDLLVEGLMLPQEAEHQLANFLEQHRRLFQNRWLRRLYAEAKEHQAALSTLARNAYVHRELRTADRLCSAALRVFPSAVLYYNRGNVYTDQRNLGMAVADFSKAIALDPQFAAAYNNRGRVLADEGQQDLAIADYTQAITLDSQYAVAFSNRGTAYLACGDTPRAIIDYTVAITRNPQYAKAYYNRGLAYREQGDLARAIADFTQAIAIDSQYTAAYNNRGVAYLAVGDLEKAIADFTQAITLNPQYANAYNNRGLAYSEHGEKAKALTDLSSALELTTDPAKRQKIENRLRELTQ